MADGKTILLARDKPTGVAWCKANGIQPFACSTHIIGGHTGRGLSVRDADRVVFVGDVERRRDWATTWSSFAPMLNLVGLDKIERVPGPAA